MNQMYADIAEKDQILNDDIKLEIDKQQEFQNIVQISSNIKQKKKKCDFCIHLGFLNEIKTLKQNYFLCDNCCESIIIYQQNQLHKNDSKLMKKIIIDAPQGLFPYDLKRGQCRSCQDPIPKILFMISKCSHYFCHPCLCVMMYFNNNKKQCCPQCNSFMDDYCQLYILLNSQPIDRLIKPKWCCINKNCELTIQSEPYKEIKAISININNDKAICNCCSKQFCALCWNSHKGRCNYEQNFKDCFKQFGIVKCPRCNCPGQSQPCKRIILWGQQLYQDQYLCQDQFCPLCGYRFCLQCLGPVQIYDSFQNNSGYTCYRCKQNFDYFINKTLRLISEMREQRRLALKYMNRIQKIKQLFKDLGFITLVVLVLIIYLGAILIFFSFEHGKNVVKNVCESHMRYYQKIPTRLQEAFLPVLLICLLVQVIIFYIITFIPAFIIYFKNMII